MRNLLLASALVTGMLGCQTASLRKCIDYCLPPEPCSNPRVEAQCPEEIHVTAPRQKIVVEVPPPAASCNAPAAPCQPAAQAPTPPALPTLPGYGQPMMAPVTTEMRERTRLGFMFDTIRIPMPILRPIAVPQPAEMTMTMPVAPAAMMPMTPMMPMAAAPMMPVAMTPMAGMGMGGPQAMGAGQMQLQGSMSANAAAAMLAAAAGMNPQQIAALAQMLAGGGLTGQQSAFLMQLASQNPQQLTALLNALGAGAQGQNQPGAQQPPQQAPPPKQDGARLQAPQPAVEITSVAPVGASSTAALQEQLRVAEQRLKELEELRAQPIK
jgi:hypothetical protein